MLNCSIILDGSAQTYGKRTAILAGGDSWTYERLHRAAGRLAKGLAAAGIAPGDRVILACPNRVEFAIAFFGILKTGAVAVPVSILWKQRELAFVMQDTQAKGVVCFEGSAALPIGQEGRAAFEETDACSRFWFIAAGSERETIDGAPTIQSLIHQAQDSLSTAMTSPEDLAVILYTSGTTGKPKGAALTHQNIFTAALTAARLVDMRKEDVSLVALPMFHCYAQTAQLNAGLLCGSTLALLERFDPDQTLRSMQDHGVTLFCGVPTMYWTLLHHKASRQYNLGKIASRLRLGCCGGAPIPAEVLRETEAKYRFQILEGYGLSETSAMTTFSQLHRPRKIGSVGLPVWGVEVQVVDEDINPLPSGANGEVVVRGHSVMQGYYNRPELLEEVFRGGWFHTGDVGQMDEEGYLYLTDRVADVIIRGGLNVYPREIEEVLASHPAVALSAVVGVPHEKYGEEVAAFIVLKSGNLASPEEIVTWTKQKVANYKYPRLVKIVESLPLGTTGKVLKKELRGQASFGEV